ncbi:MAG: tetratricopeptide repeat protein [Planctomycetaceae bacterium]
MTPMRSTLAWLAISACALVVQAADQDDVAELLDSARGHLQHGRYDEAMEIYDELVDGDCTDRELFAGRANVCLATGRWDDARDLLTAGIEAHPDDLGLRCELAELEFLRGQWDPAQSIVSEVLKTAPDEPRARLLQARLWEETGRLKEAEEVIGGLCGITIASSRAMPPRC